MALGLVDNGHAAAADDFEQLIAVVEHFSDHIVHTVPPPLLVFNEHSRHIVRRALRLGERNEIVKAFFRALTRAHGAANFVVRRGDDKAVRAEENFVPLGERDLERVAERVFVWAERAG